MIFDADVLIWALRGNSSAAQLINQTSTPQLSAVTLMEVLQGARDRQDMALAKDYLQATGFEILPLTAEIGHRATTPIERYALSHGLHLADALVAAVALCRDTPLVTCNARHYRPIEGLTVQIFRR